jgi:hypothetical protein
VQVPLWLRRSHSAARKLALASLGDTASYGVSGCLDAVLEVKLDEDAGDVVGHGVRAQRQVACDFVVAFAAGESLEDLELAVG